MDRINQTSDAKVMLFFGDRSGNFDDKDNLGNLYGMRSASRSRPVEDSFEI